MCIVLCVCVCGCARTKVGGQRTAAGVSPQVPPTFSLPETGSITGKELTSSTGCLASEPQGCTHLHPHLWVTTPRVQVPCEARRAGVTGGCEPAVTGAGTRTRVLWQSSIYPLTAEPSLQPGFWESNSGPYAYTVSKHLTSCASSCLGTFLF